jgi:hypothetical protein
MLALRTPLAACLFAIRATMENSPGRLREIPPSASFRWDIGPYANLVVFTTQLPFGMSPTLHMKSTEIYHSNNGRHLFISRGLQSSGQ